MRDTPAAILILGREEDAPPLALSDIAPRLLSSESEVLTALAIDACSLVVADVSLLTSSPESFVREVECTESSPFVIFLINDFDPHLLVTLHNSGCHKIVVRRNDWREHLAKEVRAVLRLTRMAEENELLVSQLHEANQLLREKNKRLDEFSAVLAHDIRGPLGNVLMKLEYVAGKNQDLVDERSTRFLTGARDSTARLLDIVQVMYEFARLGAKATRMGEVFLSEVLEDVLADIASEALAVDIGTLPTVWGNAELLQTVFGNLLSNSIKYSLNSRVRVKIEQGGIVERSVGPFVEIMVADDGPGLPEGDLFTLFQRGIQEKREGLGVGLAVVQRIVDLHFGTVSARSQGIGEGGSGATFLITLPLRQPFML